MGRKTQKNSIGLTGALKGLFQCKKSLIKFVELKRAPSEKIKTQWGLNIFHIEKMSSAILVGANWNKKLKKVQ